MGEIIVEIELENAGDRYDARLGRIGEDSVRRETIQAVADAGRVMLELPQDVVERLGLPTVSTVARTRADGSRDILPVAGPLTVRICEPPNHDGLHRRRRGRPSRGRPSRDHVAGPPPRPGQPDAGSKAGVAGSSAAAGVGVVPLPLAGGAAAG